MWVIRLICLKPRFWLPFHPLPISQRFSIDEQADALKMEIVLLLIERYLCVADSGFWPRQTGGVRDDRIRGHPVVQGAGNHAQLDALQ